MISPTKQMVFIALLVSNGVKGQTPFQNNYPFQGQYPLQGQFKTISNSVSIPIHGSLPIQGQIPEVPFQGQALQVPIQSQVPQLQIPGQVPQLPIQGQALQLPYQGQFSQVPFQGQVPQYIQGQFHNLQIQEQVPFQGQLANLDQRQDQDTTQPPATCRYWCQSPGAVRQFYCCPMGGKPGACPHISQEACSSYTPKLDTVVCTSDYSCGETDKCCIDPCLNKHTCQLSATPRVAQVY